MHTHMNAPPLNIADCNVPVGVSWFLLSAPRIHRTRDLTAALIGSGLIDVNLKLPKYTVLICGTLEK